MEAIRSFYHIKEFRRPLSNSSLSRCQNATTYVVILSEGKQIQKNLLAEVEGSTHLHYLVGQISE
jgi:hypothetical protein